MTFSFILVSVILIVLLFDFVKDLFKGILDFGTVIVLLTAGIVIGLDLFSYF